MPARSTTARAAVAVLTLTAFLTPAASAAAAPGEAAGPGDAGSCGRLDTRTDPNQKLDLKVGQPGHLTVTFTTARPCALDVAVHTLGRDTGITATPGGYVHIQTPAAFTWTVTGTKQTDSFLVASVQGGGTMFGIRLPDITIR